MSLHFVSTEDAQRRVTTVNGRRCAIITTRRVISPPAITCAELLDLLNEHTTLQQAEGRPWYAVELPGLDASVMCPCRDDLHRETAELLNSLGVSISDWPLYCLEEGSAP
jgi:hypothetical protein